MAWYDLIDKCLRSSISEGQKEDKVDLKEMPKTLLINVKV